LRKIRPFENNKQGAKKGLNAVIMAFNPVYSKIGDLRGAESVPLSGKNQKLYIF